MNLFRITFYNKFQEFEYFLLSEKYPGDNIVRKLLVEKHLNISFDTELWKEYKINNPNYRLDFEIIEIEQVENLITNKL